MDTQALGWLVNVASAIALSVGAWFFRGLTAELGRLREAVSALQVRLAVLDKSHDELREVKAQHAALEARVRSVELVQAKGAGT